jgi:hypothetical protein
MSETLREQERRLPTFTEERCAPIVLGNGETWFLPLPRVAYRMHIDANGEACMKRSASNASVEYAAYMEMMAQSNVDNEWLRGISVLALRLLRENYRIENDEVGDLFVFEVANDDVPLYTALGDALFGNGPKPSPDGSAQPS